MQDSPEAADLLDAIQDFLMKEVMPAVENDDGLAYKTLVSWNMLGVVSREIRQNEPRQNAELERLSKVFPESMRESNTQAEKQNLLKELNQKLADKIREEKISIGNSAIWEHVNQSVREKLEIANPRFTKD